MNSKEELKLINDFIVDNSELDELSDRLSQFNVFEVLGIANYEIRHSNTLAWLFDPKGQHGFGDSFFKRFITKVVNEAENDLKTSPVKIELGNYSDIQIFREWKNIDLLIVSEENNQVIIIENKIKAKESKGQLLKYFNIVVENWPNYEIIPLFLTIDGDEPSNQGRDVGYLPVKLELIHDLLEKLQLRLSSNQSSGVSEFIEDYIGVIKRLTMQDKDIMSLCKSIYKRHRKAIDLIVSYGGSSEVNDACVDALIDFGISTESGAVVQDVRGMVFFLPKNVAKSVGETELARWDYLNFKAPFYCWFKKSGKGSKLVMCIEVGPVIDYEHRLEVLKKLEACGLKFTKAAFNDTAVYSRGFNSKVSIEDVLGEEDEYSKLKDKASSLLKKAQPIFREMERVFK